ncbi:nitroreductase family protein [Mycetocola zhadangensis]|uniref:Putative NAD(P)H nitroreductase n=1 Tax=Mycetocola zhadangensis TaxID=1164595 RepID=A0A3L7JAK5_9MICO|nr:nitroreductase family protein [Mycetocola zhadangensis]RLQ85542.1 nitroreductase [Mycetocola zhadangensis]GGE83533.1 NAD(P)H nitroreductase [Mycetocola zhadangensis]
MPDVLAAVEGRRSYSRVTEKAPTHEDLLPLVAASARVADHGALHPWRLIELRGDDRVRLGEAIARAEHDDKPSQKPLRASLLIAIVFCKQKSGKVPGWEQEAVASGVAHTLSLLLADAGWGVIWRTGHYTRSKPVRKLHGLSKKEQLLGWLYVGGIPENSKAGHRKPIDAEQFLSVLP